MITGVFDDEYSGYSHETESNYAAIGNAAQEELEIEFNSQFDDRRERFGDHEDYAGEYIPSEEEVAEMMREHDAYCYLMCIYPKAKDPIEEVNEALDDDFPF